MTAPTGTEKLLGYGILAVVGYFGVIQPILQKLNIKDTAQEKKDKKTLENFDFGSDPGKNPFSPAFNTNLPKGTQILLISSATGQNYSDVLYNAHGIFNDDEDSVYSVFNKLKTQSQVSSLAYWFDKYKHYDLLTWLKSFLDEDEMTKISKIVAGKPKYK